jgi:hypothetical protein
LELNKENFSRISIDDMKALKEERRLQELARKATAKLDREIEEHAELLATQLINEGLDEDSFSIEVETCFRGDELQVEFFVSQLHRTMTFKVTGGDSQ